MDTLVVGAGAMGRWFAEALEAGASRPVSVAFTDADPAAARDAAQATDGRAADGDPDERFDLVCVAVPIPAAADAIAEYTPRAERAIVDVTGTAQDPVAAMREHARDLERISLHPLFAPENGPGNVAIVPDAPGPVTDEVREALTARGNHCFETTAAEHDRAMETVQARVHAAVLAFGLAAEDVPAAFQTPVSEELFDLLDQVAGGDPRVYADIQDAFEGAADVADAARAIADADHEQFRDLYREAGER
ncbi:MAG: prephenate dehydrogenase/arogenate dehydrogenase family protein [Halorientalis sp.]